MACIDIYQALTEDRPFIRRVCHMTKRVGYLMIWHRKALLILIFQTRLESASNKRVKACDFIQ